MSLWKKDQPVNGALEKALSLLGEGSHTNGDLSTPGNLRIEGSFQGKIKVEGRLVIAPSAEVKGTIQAGQVHVAGRFSGEILADESIEIAPTAHVQGQIRTRRLECERGAVLQVHCLVGEEVYQKPAPEPATRSSNNKNHR
ncbi:MAG: polymer-forming cytoskeletal protein [Bacteroidia bacterium]|nr:polymer-forming cytoskeletal protein [Bacteroidia bacterium]